MLVITKCYWLIHTDAEPVFAKDRSFPVSEGLSRTSLSLPPSVSLTQEEVNSISAILAQIRGLKQIRETKGYAFR